MKKNSTPVIILAGGLGTRLREATEFIPKPMVPIAGKPIIWHIMKTFSHYGYYRFIVCLGYRGDVIKNYFLNYRLDGVDFTVNTMTGDLTEHQINNEGWEITLVNTGQDNMTGSRVAQAARYVDTDQFMLTYGDGLANININELMSFHLSHNKLLTMTGVNLTSRFGNLTLNGNQVTAFAEKSTIADEWINGGFMVANRSLFTYLTTEKSCVLEQEPLRQVAQDGQLMLYKHRGFWQCMDTYREHQLLEELWKKGAPWKVWGNDEATFTPAVKHSTHWHEHPAAHTAHVTETETE